MTFEQTINEAGFGVHNLILDGSVHRIKPPGRKHADAWYVGHQDDDFISGAFGDWKTGEKYNYCNTSKSKFTHEQRKEYAKKMARIADQNKQAVIKRNTIAKKEVNKLWGQLTVEGLSNHPYIVRKQIKTYNIRLDSTNNLVVPLYDSSHELWSLQTITTNGSKRFYKGGRIKGCYYPIGFLNASPSRVILCEGFATGMSIYQATNIATVVCFNAGNLEGAAKELRSKHPTSHFIIAGDNDQFNQINTGKIKAENVAKNIRANMLLPIFKDLSTKPTDFNDLHCLESLEAVRKQFMEVCHVF